MTSSIPDPPQDHQTPEQCDFRFDLFFSFSFRFKNIFCFSFNYFFVFVVVLVF